MFDLAVLVVSGAIDHISAEQGLPWCTAVDSGLSIDEVEDELWIVRLSGTEWLGCVYTRSRRLWERAVDARVGRTQRQSPRAFAGRAGSRFMDVPRRKLTAPWLDLTMGPSDFYTAFHCFFHDFPLRAI